jgi:undecaprenyl-diphosphatase
MNDIFRAVILGIVEGLTEFLPISSTGHMILVMPLLGIHEGNPSFHFWNGAFDIFIQLGAILAVAIYFWRRLWNLTFRSVGTSWTDHILFKLFIAFLPAAIIGFVAADFIEAKLKNPLVVAIALIVGGAAILAIEQIIRRYSIHDAAVTPPVKAVGVGLFQCLSMIPGTSRSAATIMGGLILGMSPVAAAEFSFFLAIPTMFAAGFYSLLKHTMKGNIHSDQVVPLAVGFVVSFVVAWAVVAAFMRFIQTHKFTVFAVYRIVLGIVVLAWIFSRSPAGSP